MYLRNINPRSMQENCTLLYLVGSLMNEVLKPFMPVSCQNSKAYLYTLPKETFPGFDELYKLIAPGRKGIETILKKDLIRGNIKNVYRKWSKFVNGTPIIDTEDLFLPQKSSIPIPFNLVSLDNVLPSSKLVSYFDTFFHSLEKGADVCTDPESFIGFLKPWAVLAWGFYFAPIKSYHFLTPYYLKFVHKKLTDFYSNARATIDESYIITSRLVEQISPFSNYKEILSMAGFDSELKRTLEYEEVSPSELYGIVKYFMSSEAKDPNASKIVKETKTMKIMTPPIKDQIEAKIKVNDSVTEIKVSEYLAQSKFSYYLASNPFNIPYRHAADQVKPRAWKNFDPSSDVVIEDINDNVVADSIYDRDTLSYTYLKLISGGKDLPNELKIGRIRGRNEKEKYWMLKYISDQKSPLKAGDPFRPGVIFPPHVAGDFLTAGLIYKDSNAMGDYKITAWMSFLSANTDIVGKFNSNLLTVLSRIYMYYFLSNTLIEAERIRRSNKCEESMNFTTEAIFRIKKKPLSDIVSKVVAKVDDPLEVPVNNQPVPVGNPPVPVGNPPVPVEKVVKEPEEPKEPKEQKPTEPIKEISKEEEQKISSAISSISVLHNISVSDKVFLIQTILEGYYR